MNLKEINIEIEVIDQIVEQLKKNYVSNSKSINQDKEKQLQSNLIGKLGEYYYKQIYPDAVIVNCNDYDFIYNKQTVDVKTKKSAGIPKDYHTCDVPAYQVKNQKNDAYFFFIVNKELTKLYIVGKINKDEFLKKAKFFKQGHLVERNQFTYRVDTYSVKLGDIVNE